MKKFVFGIAVAVSALLISACGGGGKLSTKMPVSEATALRASVETDYMTVKGNWESAQTNAGQISELTGVDVNALTDIDSFKSMLVECYNTPIKAMQADATASTKDGVSAADGKSAIMVGYEQLEGCSTDKVESLASTGDASVQAFYTSKLQQVDKLRMDLLYIVPSNTKALLENAPNVLIEAGEIRARAEAALAVAQNNPLASADDKAKAQAEYDEVIRELDTVEGLANQLMEDFKNLPMDAAALAEGVVTDLQNFGQPSN